MHICALIIITHVMRMLYILYARIQQWSHESITEWRRPVGCLKLQVIFGKRATNYRALWRNMTCKDEASYVSSATLQCTWHTVSILFIVLLYRTTHSGRVFVSCTCAHPYNVYHVYDIYTVRKNTTIILWFY